MGSKCASLRASARPATRPLQLLAHVLSAERLWLGAHPGSNRKACPCGQSSPSSNVKRKSLNSPCSGANIWASFLPWGSQRRSGTRTGSEITIGVATLQVLFIVFIATLIRSTFGLGEALVAVPLLAFCIPRDVAAPLAVLVSITIAGIVVVQDWKKIHLRSTGWLVLSTLFGIPLGLLLLTSSDQRVVKATLGIVIISFSTYSLIGRTHLELKRDSRGWLLVCGFCAGVLGGAYGMNGPPLVVYGAGDGGQRSTSGRPCKDIFCPPASLAWVAIGWPDSGLPP